MNNEQYVKDDILRYTKNSGAFWLCILAIFCNVLMFFKIFSTKECTPDFQLGFDVLINIIFMLVAFLLSEKCKAYERGGFIGCFVLAGIEVARIFWIPLKFKLDGGLSTGSFIYCVVLMVVAALALAAAGVITMLKYNRLQNHLANIK